MTPKQIEQFIELFPKTRNAELMTMFGLTFEQVRYKSRMLGLKKNPDYLKKVYEEIFEKHQFKKGQPSWCKGTKGVMKNGVATRFKKGQEPHNKKPIGHIAKNREYLTIKTEQGVKQLHRYIWEQYYGEIPPNSYVRFKDGNKRNFDIENLELISSVHYMLENHYTKLPKEIREVIELKKQIIRFINNGKKQD